MKIVTVSYRHSEKFVSNYNSHESSMEITAEVEEGERAGDVMQTLKDRVRKAVADDMQQGFAVYVAPVKVVGETNK
jgi:hypothetical protein